MLVKIICYDQDFAKGRKKHRAPYRFLQDYHFLETILYYICQNKNNTFLRQSCETKIFFEDILHVFLQDRFSNSSRKSLLLHAVIPESGGMSNHNHNRRNSILQHLHQHHHKYLFQAILQIRFRFEHANVPGSRPI